MRHLSWAPILPAILGGVALDIGMYGLSVACFLSVGWLLWLLHVTGASE